MTALMASLTHQVFLILCVKCLHSATSLNLLIKCYPSHSHVSSFPTASYQVSYLLLSALQSVLWVARMIFKRGKWIYITPVYTTALLRFELPEEYSPCLHPKPNWTPFSVSISEPTALSLRTFTCFLLSVTLFLQSLLDILLFFS